MEENNLDNFTDSNDISDWAKTHVDDLNDKGVIIGDAHGTFKPKKGIKIAEASIMLSRAEKLKK